MAMKPAVLWAQREGEVFVTIDLKDVKEQKLEVTDEKLSFSGKSNEKEYAFEFEWHKPVKSADVKCNTKRLVEIYAPKAEEESWSRVNKEGKLQYVKIDWNKWVDSDDEGGDEGFDTQGMGGMDPMGGKGMGKGGMPGMGGMGGMPGMGGMDFSQMMGGMGGGAGGMPDMGGMGGGMGGLEAMMGGKGGGKGGMDMEAMMKAMGGMGGMGGMPGMGGEEDGEEGDSDDEDDLPDLDAPVEGAAAKAAGEAPPAVDETQVGA